MAARKKTPPKIARRTPVLEWAAAALGLLLTLTILGYSLWEGVTDQAGPPQLSITAEPAERTAGGYVVPFTVRNSAYATAAGVEVSASLEQGGRIVEERRTTFTYVPGRGEAKGGVIFQVDPAAARLRLEAEGYQDP